MQVAQFSDPNPEANLAQYFYNEAWAHLANSKQTLGHYTESDAIASLLLVSYALLSRGTTDWRYMLEVACEWLNQTGITVDEQPKYTMSNMTSSRQFALKATMVCSVRYGLHVLRLTCISQWLDIVSSMTLMRPPRYLALYRSLFGSSRDFWATPGHNHNDSYELRMDSLTGCPDDVMLGIAEVSALADWKLQEQRNGCLSVRELIRRGGAIEQQLRTHTEPESFAEVDQAPMHPSLPGTNIDYAGSPSLSALSCPVDTTIQFPSEEMRRVVASLYRESTILYLHTVLNDPIPGTFQAIFPGKM
jgi:C6 transcription factor Pro1